jgi:hypothetical protein
MEELIMVVLKAMWGVVQIFYVLIRFIFQTIFFLHSKIPKSPEVYTYPEEVRFEHMLIVGGSGHGKTQLLQHIFMTFDLREVAAGRKSVVFIDSQGDMLQKILHLRELTPARAQEGKPEEPKPATATPLQTVPETLPKKRTRMRRGWYIAVVLLVNVIVLAVIFGGVVITQAIFLAGQEEDITLGSTIFAFALVSVPWLLLSSLLFQRKRDEHPSSQSVASPSQAAVDTTHPTLADRLVLIDPNDVENPPCLNLFDFGLDRIKDYSAVDREKFVNSAIALYEYMFGALLGAELSHRQGVIFRYLARLLMVVPNPTIYTLMDFMEEPERVREYLPKLDMQTQRFFVTQFFSHKFDDTRQQILTRLWGVLSNNVLARMFSHTHNKLNLLEAMNRGSLILINTAKDLLKQEGCEIFGRFMVTCLSQATQERAALPEEKRLPTFIYIDEAADYFDDSLEELLNTARKYMVGLIIATQNLGQFSQKLLASVLSSTSIKFAGGVSRHDAVALAGEMKAEPEFILSAQKGGGQTQFVTYVRNYMSEAVGFAVPLGTLEHSSKMGNDDFNELLKQNREKYTAAYEPALLDASSAIAQSGVTFALDEPQRPI